MCWCAWQLGPRKYSYNNSVGNHMPEDLLAKSSHITWVGLEWLGALGTPQKPELHCSTFWFTLIYPKILRPCYITCPCAKAGRIHCHKKHNGCANISEWAHGYQAFAKRHGTANILCGDCCGKLDWHSLRVYARVRSRKLIQTGSYGNGESVTYQEKICKAAVVQANHLGAEHVPLPVRATCERMWFMRCIQAYSNRWIPTHWLACSGFFMQQFETPIVCICLWLAVHFRFVLAPSACLSKCAHGQGGLSLRVPWTCSIL